MFSPNLGVAVTDFVSFRLLSLLLCPFGFFRRFIVWSKVRGDSCSRPLDCVSSSAPKKQQPPQPHWRDILCLAGVGRAVCCLAHCQHATFMGGAPCVVELASGESVKGSAVAYTLTMLRVFCDLALITSFSNCVLRRLLLYLAS